MHRYIRITTESQLSDQEIDQVYEIVSEITDIHLTSAYHEDGELADDSVAISMYEEQSEVIYEIKVDDDTSYDDLDQIVSSLTDAIAQDFEIELIRD